MSFNIKSIANGQNVRKIIIAAIVVAVALPIIKKLKGGF